MTSSIFQNVSQNSVGNIHNISTKDQQIRNNIIVQGIHQNYRNGLIDSGQQHLEAWTDDCALAVWLEEGPEL